MSDTEIQRWLENAERGISEHKPQFVLASSKKLRALNRKDLAEQVLRDGYVIFHDTIEIFRALATIIRERDSEEALRFAEEATDQFGGNARFQKALALADLGRRLDAINEIEEVVNDDPSFREDRYIVTKLFDLYNDEGLFLEARNLLEPLVDAGIYTDARIKQELATVLCILRQSLPKVLDLLKGHVDPQSTRIKQQARDIMQDVAEPVAEQSHELHGTKLFFAYAIKRKDVVLQLARHLERSASVPCLLMDEESHEGRSLVEKFEELASTCGFGVFVLTGDDRCGDTPENSVKRPRQNVILELGYFLGKLGRRKRIAILVEQGVDIPSDLGGLGWIPITSDLAETKLRLLQELKSAGFIQG